MKPLILTFFIFCLASTFCLGQTLEQMCQQILTKNIVAEKIKFDHSTKKDGKMVTEIEYLGAVKTSQGKTFKILTFAYTWGPNSHTAGSILIYTDKNKYSGRYYLGDARDIPKSLKNGNLLFDNSDNKDCDKNLLTTINLKNGLPKEIFIKCKGEFGDIYSLTTEK